MPTTITAGVRMYSMFSARPVTYAPHGPIADRAKLYAPPACGSAGDISAMLKHRPRYMTVMIAVAISRPPNPPSRSPYCQPKKSPEITAPTPSAQSDQTRACRRSPRCSKYPGSTSSYATPFVFFGGAAAMARARIARIGYPRSKGMAPSRGRVSMRSQVLAFVAVLAFALVSFEESRRGRVPHGRRPRRRPRRSRRGRAAGSACAHAPRGTCSSTVATWGSRPSSGCGSIRAGTRCASSRAVVRPERTCVFPRGRTCGSTSRRARRRVARPRPRCRIDLVEREPT